MCVGEGEGEGGKGGVCARTKRWVEEVWRSVSVHTRPVRRRRRDALAFFQDNCCPLHTVTAVHCTRSLLSCPLHTVRWCL